MVYISKGSNIGETAEAANWAIDWGLTRIIATFC
jgi:hypothetical protein